MRDPNMQTRPEFDANTIARLAQMLGIEIAPDDLAALAEQLRMLDDLEMSELQDTPPILTMDADWHD